MTDQLYQMNTAIQAYNNEQAGGDKEICELLAAIINKELPAAESKIWHGHPVWFLAGNPIVGYSKQKPGIRLMFWSGADFNVPGKKFKDASVFYTSADEITARELRRWLKKSKAIQWDYEHIVKRKGVL